MTILASFSSQLFTILGRLGLPYGLLALLATVMVVILTRPQALFAQQQDDAGLFRVAEGEVIEDDLYIGAQQVIIDGTVIGDLFVGANQLIINGVVEGDLYFVAANVVLNGHVTGDLHGAAQSLEVQGRIDDDLRAGLVVMILRSGAVLGDDLLLAGYSTQTEAGSKIGGDLLLAGAQAVLAGELFGDLMAQVGGLKLNGLIGGNVELSVGPEGDPPAFNPFTLIPNSPGIPILPGGLQVGDDAVVVGDFTYSSIEEASIPSDVVGGTVTFEPQLTDEQTELTTTERLFNAVRRVTGLLLVGILLAWLLGPWIDRAKGVLDEKAVPSLGLGLMAVVLTPFVLLLLTAMIIFLVVVFNWMTLSSLSGAVLWIGGALIIFVVTVFMLIWSFISKIIVGYWLGDLLLGRSDHSRWAPLLLGLLLISVLVSIPYLGPLANILIALFGFGTLWILLNRLRSTSPEVAPVETPTNA